MTLYVPIEMGGMKVPRSNQQSKFKHGSENVKGAELSTKFGMLPSSAYF